MGARDSMRAPLRALGAHLHDSDASCDWFTLPAGAPASKFYDLRFQLPFSATLADTDAPGGLIVHYDQPQEPPKAVLTHDLTPSEVALSKVLAAWVEWWVAAPSCGPDGDCMSDVGLSLIKRGMVNRNGTTSPAGAALLDRARKAGVL